MTVHNHPPYRPMCNETQTLDGLKGACMTDREWRATHCIGCWPPPDHCTDCPCHEPREEDTDGTALGSA